MPVTYTKMKKMVLLGDLSLLGEDHRDELVIEQLRWTCSMIKIFWGKRSYTLYEVRLVFPLFLILFHKVLFL